MTPQHSPRTSPTEVRAYAASALALLALLCATTASAQTPPTGWPWGSGFERRTPTTAAPQPELPPDTAPASPTSRPSGSGIDSKNTRSGRSHAGQGAGQSGNRGGRGGGGR